MSYPAFGETGAQPQQPAQEHGGFGATGGPDQQQNPMGQQMDSSSSSRRDRNVDAASEVKDRGCV